jgi:hypothetical protein
MLPCHHIAQCLRGVDFMLESVATVRVSPGHAFNVHNRYRQVPAVAGHRLAGQYGNCFFLTHVDPNESIPWKPDQTFSMLTCLTTSPTLESGLLPVFMHTVPLV